MHYARCESGEKRLEGAYFAVHEAEASNAEMAGQGHVSVRKESAARPARLFREVCIASLVKGASSLHQPAHAEHQDRLRGARHHPVHEQDGCFNKGRTGARGRLRRPTQTKERP